jgi:hypothetical protein
MAHHKRTKRNMLDVLERYLIHTDKRGVASGLKENYVIIITEFKLNKACSLLHVWWDLVVLNQINQTTPDIPINNPHLLQTDLKMEKVARIQKNLDKASSYFAGKICQGLGLRYSPEIRFYFDQANDEKEALISEEGGMEGIVGIEHDKHNYK